MEDKQLWDWLKQMKNQGLSMLKISKYARLDYNKFMAQLNLHSTPEDFFTPKQKERLLEKINHIKNVCNEPL